MIQLYCYTRVRVESDNATNVGTSSTTSPTCGGQMLEFFVKLKFWLSYCGLLQQEVEIYMYINSHIRIRLISFYSCCIIFILPTEKVYFYYQYKQNLSYSMKRIQFVKCFFFKNLSNLQYSKMLKNQYSKIYFCGLIVRICTFFQTIQLQRTYKGSLNLISNQPQQ